MKYLKALLIIIFISLFAYQEIRIRKLERFGDIENISKAFTNIQKWADGIHKWQHKVYEANIEQTVSIDKLIKTTNWLLERKKQQ